MLIKKHNSFFGFFRKVTPYLQFEILIALLVYAIALTIVFPIKVNAAEVALAWDASKISNLAGYNLYYRQCQLTETCSAATVSKSSLKVWPIKVGDLSTPSNPKYTINNLSDIHKYAFALTVYNAAGQESGFSNEVNFTPSTSSSTTNNGSSSSSTSGESGSPTNQAPKVNAGKDQSIDISMGKTILAGIVTDDGLPKSSQLSYTWQQSSGPGTAKFDNASQPTTAVGFDKTGAYTLVLKAGDGALSASDSLVVNVFKAESGSASNSGSTNTSTTSQAIIIDNKDTNNTTSTGGWAVSGGASSHAGDSLYAYAKNSAAFSWRFISPNTGTYDLSAWWTYHKTRSSAVPISIESKDGVKIVIVDQLKNGGKWNSLGQFKFVAGESYQITVTPAEIYPKSTCADAIKLSYVSADTQTTGSEQLIIDNMDSKNTASTGTWQNSGGTQPYAGNSVYGKNGATFSWKFVGSITGTHDVSIWWTLHSTRSAAVPVDIKSDSGFKQLKLNQQQNAGKWVSLGEYKFTAGKSYEIKMTATQGNETACADAVRIMYRNK